ncbi:hypothetical protein [Neorhizobium lilium]|uniref:hypothetical protein n=1 Tax=Neorhizobium lilium TaxID=2503024 RepID=UPI0013E2F99E|nr:hypothetical protein [Neorhizobium lilium]
MSLNLNCWAISDLKIEKPRPQQRKPFLSLRQDLRVAFAGDMIEGHLDASLDDERMPIFFAKTRALVLCKFGEPSNPQGTNRLVSVIEDEMRGLVIVPIKDKGGRDAMLMHKTNASEDHGIANMVWGGCDLASEIGKSAHYRSASFSGPVHSTLAGRKTEGRTFQGGFQI